MARGRSGTPIRSRAGDEQTATLNRSKPRCKYDYTATHRCESRSRDTARRAERTECQSARECRHARLNAESTPPSSCSAAPLARSGGRSPSARPRLRVATRTLPVPRSLRCTAVEDLGERGEGRRREPTAPARTPTAHTPSQLRRRPNRTYTTRLGMRPQGPAALGCRKCKVFDHRVPHSRGWA